MVGRPALMLLPALIALAVAPARAQPGGPVVGAEQALVEQARLRFQEGLDHADRGDWERAVERFRRALELRDAPPVRFNLARSLAEMGRLVEAIEELDVVLAAPRASAEVLQAARALRDGLAPRLGRLRVGVQAPVGEISVTVDGRPLPASDLGRSVVTDPGVRVLRLLRGVEELDVEEVDVPEGGAAAVVLEVPAPLRALQLTLGQREAAAPVASRRRGADAGWWVLGGLAVLAVAGGVVAAAVAAQGSSRQDGATFDPPTLRFP
ncbi:MAG: tetratricopeptide repeat protein [Sandaracinaceae bacterium]